MTFRPGDRIFIDESKARGYFLVGTAVAVRSLSAAEKLLRELLKPGQRRIHFKSESDSRRREILSRMCELDLRAAVLDAGRLSDKPARILTLTRIVEDAVSAQVGEILIERDESLIDADRRLIASVLRDQQSASVSYRHVVPHEHPILWVSDAIAWCYGRGGDWIRRVQPIASVRPVAP